MSGGVMEVARCQFCLKDKPVSRRYVYAANLNENKDRDFVIIFYCSDCGILADGRPWIPVAEAKLTPNTVYWATVKFSDGSLDTGNMFYSAAGWNADVEVLAIIEVPNEPYKEVE